jgi:hypothetical protein
VHQISDLAKIFLKFVFFCPDLALALFVAVVSFGNVIGQCVAE